jgi:hypothetical protein
MSPRAARKHKFARAVTYVTGPDAASAVWCSQSTPGDGGHCYGLDDRREVDRSPFNPRHRVHFGMRLHPGVTGWTRSEPSLRLRAVAALQPGHDLGLARCATRASSIVIARPQYPKQHRRKSPNETD